MFALMLITDPEAPQGIVRSVEAALGGVGQAGARVAVLLRAKQVNAAALLPIARELRELTARAGVTLSISRELEVAREVGADGVHLPESGPPPSAARSALGPAALIGASCHDPRGVSAAAVSGADYVTLSPVFASPGKGAPLGLSRFAEWTRAATLPVIALGGVRAEHVAPLRGAGAAGVAVISSVFAAEDPGNAVRALLAALDL